MAFKIRTFIASDGERFSQLYRLPGCGFPEFYPAAFISRSIRRSATHETQKVYLEAIKRVSEWEEISGFDLGDRFHRQEFLSNAETDSLTAYLGKSRSKSNSSIIGRIKHNIFISYAELYLSWLANEVITDPNAPETKKLIEIQSKSIKSKITKKTGSTSKKLQNLLQAKLNSAARETLLELFENPFNDSPEEAIRFRNIIMIRVLYETGMRRGELLSLKLRNFTESGGGDAASLLIERNHNDEFDSRLHQPVVKTEGRTLPVSDELEQQLITYRDEYRAETPNAQFDDQSFLFINHRAGQTQAKPVSQTGFDSALANLKSKFPSLSGLHPHLLRHDWNYRFSVKCDESRWPEEIEQSMRRILMGWAEHSQMPKVHNKRHIVEKANEVGYQIAQDTARKKSETRSYP